MKTPIRHIPGILKVQATPEIEVSYDAHFNMVEIMQGTKVLQTEIAPRQYTVSQFMTTLQRVRDHYQKGGTTL